MNEHMKALKAFHEALRDAEAESKAGRTQNSKALLRALPSFGGTSDHFANGFMSRVEDQLISQVNLIDAMASVKSYWQAAEAAGLALAFFKSSRMKEWRTMSRCSMKVT